MAEEEVKIRSIVIDTLTAIQNEIYMRESVKVGFNQWMDFGKGIWKLVSDLQALDWEIIFILSEPGTGKSTAMRNLPHNTNVWFNADKKNPVWIGGKEEYGTKKEPRVPYHFIPNTYEDIIKALAKMEEKKMLADHKFAFLTGHTEDYKTDNITKRRLKVLGQMATKFQLEGRAESVFYGNVIFEGESRRYVFETQNSGLNTARSPMGLFDPIIDNDYNLIINKLLTY